MAGAAPGSAGQFSDAAMITPDDASRESDAQDRRIVGTGGRRRLFAWLGTHATAAVASAAAAGGFPRGLTSCGQRQRAGAPAALGGFRPAHVVAQPAPPARHLPAAAARQRADAGRRVHRALPDKTIEADFDARGWSVPLGVISIVAMLVAWRLFRRAQKYEAPDADEVMRSDPRPPVLYLRSFRDDGGVAIAVDRACRQRCTS